MNKSLASILMTVVLMSGVVLAGTVGNSSNYSTTNSQNKIQKPPTPNVSEWVCSDGSNPTFKEMQRPERNMGNGQNFDNKRPPQYYQAGDDSNRPEMPQFNQNGNDVQRPPMPPEFNNSNSFKNSKNTSKGYSKNNKERRTPPGLTCSDGSTPTRKTTTTK